jgi:hypothetical protein
MMSGSLCYCATINKTGAQMAISHMLNYMLKYLGHLLYRQLNKMHTGLGLTD